MSNMTIAERVKQAADAGRLDPNQILRAVQKGWLDQSYADPAVVQRDAVHTLNRNTLLGKVQTALDNNDVYLSRTAPTTAQNTAQIKALTRQVNALLRLVSEQLDNTNGT